MDENQLFTEQQVMQAINSSYGAGVMDTLMGLARNAEQEVRKNLVAKMGAVIIKSTELGTELNPEIVKEFTAEFFGEYMIYSLEEEGRNN